MDNNDKTISHLLNTIKIVPPSANLNEKIIAQASLYKENEKSIFSHIMRIFPLPKPAYILASSMLFGSLIGWQGYSLLNMHEIQIITASEELSILFLGEISFYE